MYLFVVKSENLNLLNYLSSLKNGKLNKCARAARHLSYPTLSDIMSFLKHRVSTEFH